MSAVKDHTGKQFGRLKVTNREGSDSRGRALWLCLCHCGNQTVVPGKDLSTGKIKSCGCLRRSLGGLSSHLLYDTWKQMHSRCTNPNNPNYKHYGGRGIKVCKRWNVFENFLKDMGARPKNYSLERIDNDKGYNKSNCKWSSSKDQVTNRRVKTVWGLRMRSNIPSHT